MDKYLHFNFITCCTVDGDLSIVLYSDNELFGARKFGDGLLETPPLHWEWSCAFLNIRKYHIKNNINHNTYVPKMFSLKHIIIKYLFGMYIFLFYPEFITDWLLLFKTSIPWSSLSYSALLNFDFRLNEGLEIFHEYRLWSFSPFSPL